MTKIVDENETTAKHSDYSDINGFLFEKLKGTGMSMSREELGAKGFAILDEYVSYELQRASDPNDQRGLEQARQRIKSDRNDKTQLLRFGTCVQTALRDQPTKFQLWKNQSPKPIRDDEFDKFSKELLAKVPYDHSLVTVGNDFTEIPVSDYSKIVSWKGISVDWLLKTFMVSPEVKPFVDHGCQMWFFRKYVVAKIMHRRGINAGPFVDHVDEMFPSDPAAVEMETREDPVCEKATAFVSYTGAYSLPNFLEMLRSPDLRGKYVWSDILCVDQVRYYTPKEDEEKFHREFMHQLRKKIQDIKCTVLLLDHWEGVMDTLKKIWVLWEIFSAVDKGDKMIISTNNFQIERFEANGLASEGGIVSIGESIANIDVSKATSYNKEDANMILDLMKESGIVHTNKTVIKTMKDWLYKAVEAHYEGEVKAGRHLGGLSDVIAKFYMAFDDHQNAEKVSRDALATTIEEIGTEKASYFEKLSTLGEVLMNQGRIAEAKEYLATGVAGLLKTKNRYNPSTHRAILKYAHCERDLGNEQLGNKLLCWLKEESKGISHIQEGIAFKNLVGITKEEDLADLKVVIAQKLYNLRKSKYPPNHHLTLEAQSDLGLRQFISRKKYGGKTDEAEKNLRDAVDSLNGLSLEEYQYSVATAKLNLARYLCSLSHQDSLSEAYSLGGKLLKSAIRSSEHSLRINVLYESFYKLCLALEANGAFKEALYLTTCLRLHKMGWDRIPLKITLKRLRTKVATGNDEDRKCVLNTGGEVIATGDKRNDKRNKVIDKFLVFKILEGGSFAEFSEKLMPNSGSRGMDYAKVLIDFAKELSEENDFFTAGELYSAALEERRTRLGNHNLETILAMQVVGDMLCKQGRHDEALPILREVVELFPQLQEAEEKIEFKVGFDNSLAVALKGNGLLNEAECLLRNAFQTCPSTELGFKSRCAIINNLASVLRVNGNAEEAISFYKQSMDESWDRIDSREHTQILLSARRNFALFLEDSGELQKAKDVLTEVVHGMQGMSPKHPSIADAEQELAKVNMSLLLKQNAVRPIDGGQLEQMWYRHLFQNDTPPSSRPMME